MKASEKKKKKKAESESDGGGRSKLLMNAALPVLHLISHNKREQTAVWSQTRAQI